MRLSLINRRRSAAAVGMLLFSSVLTILDSGQADAALATCGTPGNYFDGAENTASTAIYGVAADIETQEPALCSAAGGSSSSSSAWAMLTPAGQNDYAQAGYVKNGVNVTQYPTGFHYLAQYTTTTGGVVTFISGNPGTSTHTYAVYLRASDDRVHMTYDGVNMLTMNYDTTGNWNTAWQGQFYGETWHAESDVVGSNANRARFNRIYKYNSAGTETFITDLSGLATSIRYAFSIANAAVGGKYIDIWTQ